MKRPKSLLVLIFSMFFCINYIAAQTDSSKEQRFNIHGQATVITQFQSGFNAKYSGPNSLADTAENATSITASLFMTGRLWKNATLSFDPEIAGGKGISQVLGIAQATNGETFRIGSPEPKVYIARLFFNQIIPLTKERTWQEEDVNQLHVQVPTKYLSFVAGKISLEDYFDNNAYAHDPRDQFMNWNLMAAGAWDYPANTRGYAPSIVLQYISPGDELRYAFSLIPKEANGSDMNWNLGRSHSQTIEYAHHYFLNHCAGSVRILGFLTDGKMGDYQQAVQAMPSAPDITLTRAYGRTKYGFALNADQSLSRDFGVFARGSWNDGKTETWVFTEIDRALTIGGQLNGQRWNRAGDKFGFAYGLAGISREHRDYLDAGGNGFMLGDGHLNYAPENLLELYYNAQVTKNIFISADEQVIVNPGYNKDRKGPVNIFSLRVHYDL